MSRSRKQSEPAAPAGEPSKAEIPTAEKRGAVNAASDTSLREQVAKKATRRD